MRIRSLLGPHRVQLTGVVLLSVLAAIGEAVGLGLVSLFLNQLLGSTDALPRSALLDRLSASAKANPGFFFALLALTYVFRSVVALVANYASIAVAWNIVDGWRMRLFGGILRMPAGAEVKQGVLVQAVLDEPPVAAAGLAGAGMLVQAAVSALTVYATLLYLSATIALALTVIAMIAMAALMVLFRHSRRIAEQRLQIFREGYAYVTEMLGSLRQIKLFGLEPGIERRTDGLVTRMRVVQRSQTTMASSPRLLIEIVFVAAFAVMLAFLSRSMQQAEIVSAAGLAVVAAMRLLPSFSSAAGTWIQVQRAIPAIRHIGDELTRLEATAREPADAVPAPAMSRDIVLRDVRFSYPGRAWGLRGIDLRIQAGSFVAVVGPSGSGKSTVLDLVCGLHQPEGGQILVDGTDLRGISKSSWREQLGVVPQDGFLLSGTIRENLCLLRPDCPDRVMREAVALVGAEEIIQQLPAGYETVVGERGVSLSGGQRQRLALARVLIREPRVLILDEATSALDADSDDKIFRALQGLRGRMTIIAVAHRMASIQRADCIHVLDGGRVVESGDHETLLRSGGTYASLCRAAESGNVTRATAESGR